MAGAAAGVLSWAVIYPVDVVKSTVQSRAPGQPSLGALATTRALLRDGGIARLYRGVGFTLLRAGPVAGLQLPLFDIVLAALRDGSHLR